MKRLIILLKRVPFIVSLFRIYVVFSGKIRFCWNKIICKTYSEEDLYKRFSKIGIYPGDKIMIHSSMSRIGVLKDGPNTFVKAIKKYIGEKGLIVMPTFPHRGSYEYLSNYTMFDIRHTPSRNGAISECFRKSENVYRSLHPTHPLAAWGEAAKELMSGHEKTKSMFDEKSPFKKILDLNVKIVLIGVNFDHMTMMRLIEDLYDEYPINVYCNNTFEVPIIGYDGEIINVTTKCHDPQYFGRYRDNTKLYDYMKNDVKISNLGNAKTMVLYSQDMYNKQLECCKNGIYFFKKLRFK